MRNVIDERHTIDGFKDDRWNRPMAPGDIVPAVVVTAPKTGAARLRIGSVHADLEKAGYAWTRRTSAADLFKPGDLIDVAIAKLDAATGAATVTLEQSPLAEGAILAIDNHTGQIKAMVGGWSFSRSKFNRAVQAYRQLGSTFKPIVYTAAIDRGFTPSSIIVDAPVSYSAGNGQIYSPHNYDHKFLGPITLRYALEESRNIPAIKMMDTLGPKNVLEFAKRFGFEEDFPPYLPIALGAGDATLLDITSAYTTFPNQGVRMKPFSVLTVKDRDGNLLEENRAEPSDVIRADTAFVMTNMLRGVLSLRGTGAKATAMASAVAARRQDRHRRRQHRRVVRRLRSGHHGRRVARLRRQAQVARQRRAGRVRGAADLDGVHEGLHRRPARQGRSAGVRRARQHRLPGGGQGQRLGAAGGDAGLDPRGVHLGHPARREHVQPAAVTRTTKTPRHARNARRRKTTRCLLRVVLRALVSSWSTQRSRRRYLACVWM